MFGRSYPNVINLDMGLNNIDDKAIDYMVGADMPRLNILALDNTGVTIKGLMRIFEMDLPMLEQIGIMNNKFSQKDLIYLINNLPY
jgi:hypothetical protein